MIANVENFSSCEPIANWWKHSCDAAASPQIRITSRDRLDFLSAVQWSLRESADSIWLRFASGTDSPGTRLALKLCWQSSVLHPESQSLGQWIDRCLRWELSRRGEVDDALPPLPWDRDRSGIAAIYCTLARSEARMMLADDVEVKS
ncbi:hypothetical protein [Rhodopirellula europaea]|uniref:hypothetical protein n=1 Tax=Rhodopirellula europaea TaxID=1263866 RepID=UPI003D2941A5|tara:strand:- start:3200 stop:3640 length:441 start_codon:yes stop_codon:yes gene_type:complete